MKDSRLQKGRMWSAPLKLGYVLYSHVCRSDGQNIRNTSPYNAVQFKLSIRCGFVKQLQAKPVEHHSSTLPIKSSAEHSVKHWSCATKANFISKWETSTGDRLFLTPPAGEKDRSDGLNLSNDHMFHIICSRLQHAHHMHTAQGLNMS